MSVQEKRPACGQGNFFFVDEVAGVLDVAVADDEALAVMGVVGSGLMVVAVAVAGGAVDSGGRVVVVVVEVEADEGVGKAACGESCTRGSEE